MLGRRSSPHALARFPSFRRAWSLARITRRDGHTRLNDQQVIHGGAEGFSQAQRIIDPPDEQHSETTELDDGGNRIRPGVALGKASEIS